MPPFYSKIILGHTCHNNVLILDKVPVLFGLLNTIVFIAASLFNVFIDHCKVKMFVIVEIV